MKAAISKTTFCLITLLTLSTNTFCQKLSLEELQVVVKLPFSDVETFLLKKDYNLTDTETDSSKTFVEYENENTGRVVRVTKYGKETKPTIQDIEYTTMSKQEFINIKEYVKLKKFKLQKTIIDKGEFSKITTIYSLGNTTFFLYAYSSKSETSDEKINWYKIQMSIYFFQ